MTSADVRTVSIKAAPFVLSSGGTMDGAEESVEKRRVRLALEVVRRLENEVAEINLSEQQCRSKTKCDSRDLRDRLNQELADITRELPAASHTLIALRQATSSIAVLGDILHGRDILQDKLAQCESVRSRLNDNLIIAEADLQNALNAPVSGGVDPTEWLPDELLIIVLLKLDISTLWACRRQPPCRRWWKILTAPPLMRWFHQTRWTAFSRRWIRPKVVGECKSASVSAVVSRGDDTVACGLTDGTITLWNIRECRLVRTFSSGTSPVLALAICPRGRVFCGSAHGVISVWCSETGNERCMLKENVVVNRLCIGHHDDVYGSTKHADPIVAWDTTSGTFLRALLGHECPVTAMAIGHRGQLYSGSSDAIIAWSGKDGSRLYTVSQNHDTVFALSVGRDRRLYAAMGSATEYYRRKTVVSWSGETYEELKRRELFSVARPWSGISLRHDGHVFIADLTRLELFWPRFSVDYHFGDFGIYVDPSGRLFSDTKDGRQLLRW